jgi:aminopeptidase YwaD
MRPTLELLESELSGERAREHVAVITRHYRSPGSPGFHAVIDYITTTLRSARIEPSIRTFPLDGRSAIGDDATPLGWEPRGATLELLPSGEVLVDWHDCPSCLPWWCRATPPGGVELEIVDVGTGETEQQYAGKDVTGRAVLISDARENFAWPDIVARAARHGAAAILSDYLIYQYEPWRTRSTLPDAVQQMRLPARGESPWALCVSGAAFQRLLRAAAEPGEPARVRVVIDARTFESTSRSVLATIPGASLPDEGILFVSHVSAATMPGANCASGVALGLELVQTITRLIHEGRIDRPARSVHFLFANEGFGSVELALAKPAFTEGLLAAFALCSVGHDQGETKSTLVLGRSPDALPTTIDDVVETLVDLQTHQLPWAYRSTPQDIPYVRWKVLPYTPWSDNATWSKLGVPGLLFMSLPDRYFHTQLLTVEKTDPRVFVSSGAVTGTAALVLAAAQWPGAAELMRASAIRARRRLDAIALEALASGPVEPTRAARLADAARYTADRDAANIATAVGLAPPEFTAAATEVADRLSDELREHAAAVAADVTAVRGSGPEPPSVGDAAPLVPTPIGGLQGMPHGVPGLTYAEMLALAERMSRRDPAIVLESLQVIADSFWSRCDGTADIESITRSIGHEFDFDIAVRDIHSVALGLERAGLLRLAER